MENKQFNQTEYIRNYSKEHYSKLSTKLPKQLVEQFKEKCNKENISYNGCIKQLIENYLNKN